MKIKEKVLKKVQEEGEESIEGFTKDLLQFSYEDIKEYLNKTFVMINKVINEVLTNTRRKVNEEIKDEQAIAHSHTAINQIEDGLKKELSK